MFVTSKEIAMLFSKMANYFAFSPSVPVAPALCIFSDDDGDLLFFTILVGI